MNRYSPHAWKKGVCKDCFQPAAMHDDDVVEDEVDAPATPDRPTAVPSGTSPRVFGSPAAPKCTVCDKRVFAMERMALQDMEVHKLCFKCHTCRTTLSQKTYISVEGTLYCRAHAAKLQSSPLTKTNSRFITHCSSPLSHSALSVRAPSEEGLLPSDTSAPAAQPISQATTPTTNQAAGGGGFKVRNNCCEVCTKVGMR